MYPFIMATEEASDDGSTAKNSFYIYYPEKVKPHPYDLTGINGIPLGNYLKLKRRSVKLTDITPIMGLLLLD